MFERTYFNTCFNTYLNTPPDTLGHHGFQYMFQYTFKYTCGYTWPCITLYWPVNVSNIVLDIWYKHVSTLHFAVHTMYHHRIIPIHHCIPSIWLIQLECSFEYISNTKLNTHQTDLFDTSGTLFNTFWNTNAKHLLNTWISTPKIFVSVHVFRLSIIVANTRIRLIHVLNRYTLDTRLIQRNTWFWILHKKRPLTAWETPFHARRRALVLPSKRRLWSILSAFGVVWGVWSGLQWLWKGDFDGVRRPSGGPRNLFWPSPLLARRSVARSRGGRVACGLGRRS